jgi:hypothetical protein
MKSTRFIRLNSSQDGFLGGLILCEGVVLTAAPQLADMLGWSEGRLERWAWFHRIAIEEVGS